MMTDKNGKEIKVGDQVIYDNFLGIVYAINEDSIELTMKEFNIILKIDERHMKRKTEIVTEQEALIFLLKRKPNEISR